MTVAPPTSGGEQGADEEAVASSHCEHPLTLRITTVDTTVIS